jgi:hypothetical protein
MQEPHHTSTLTDALLRAKHLTFPMTQQDHLGEAMTRELGALPSEAIRAVMTFDPALANQRPGYKPSWIT